jgi:predicted Na+-dependent transporter
MIKTFIEKHAGIIFGAALLLGVLLPLNIQNISSILMPLLIVLLYLSFLSVDLSHVKSELKRPLQLSIQVVWNFLIIPGAIFLILRQLGFTHFATAAMLLAAMPAGLASPVLTSIAGGRVATSVVLTIVTHILVPLSVPLLFWLFADVDVNVDVASLSKKMTLLIGIPIILAFISRMFLKKVVQSTKNYHKITSILAIAIIAYLVITPHAETIRSDFLSVVPMLIGSYSLFALLCVTSFALSRKRKPDEQAALVITRVYMNNALAIVLAFQFFSPEVTLITILAEIPWFTTFGAYLWFQKRFIL